ncbi:N-acetylmuramoyl-L-alanine amidase family protein [Paenibacillus motobuensis]|uniref:N-acetylmuramoyl-L-alanine amidase family protein n=1 Tax=Paenibacillus TaxID=44249 RepID=UPI00204012A3|nr:MULTISPECIES: N-acetylmuramoyl-L-alanine amidase family protein [Paenibacillus]MCM3040069.1 N-acetylmuramoyl-L-alanine amidase family protein [Paenibacillus lutimineralis]MCM3647173.1 N-acetylmuramoyl-L-alanine amidase family protein [Paenibacillus motobuensis]
MKKIGFGVLMFFVMFMLVLPQIGHAASGGTSIVLDGKALNLPANGQVQNLKGNVMIPIRVVSEELGFDVNWEKKTRTVTIQQLDTVLKLVVDQSTAIVNGDSVRLPVAPKLVSDTVIVPLRFVGEQMGLKVSWDNKAKTAYLVSPNSGSGSGSGGNAGSGNQPSNPGQVENLANINGISFSNNQLMIAVDKNVKPSVFTMNGPDRIVIDIPNARFGDSFATGQNLDSNKNGSLEVSDYPGISRIRYALFSDNPSTVRVVMDMDSAKKYKLVNNNDGLVIIDLNVDDSTSPGTTPGGGGNGKKLVIIDAGHGGSDPGAISITKKNEKDFTLAVALKVQALLQMESQIEVVMTRESDTYPTLSDRSNLANKLNADIFVSIHGNSGPSTATGVETFYTRSDSAQLAKVMHKYLVKSTGLADRKVKTQSLHVTRETKMPAVLLECGFLSNSSDESKMYTEQFQDSVADGIVKGIKEYFGM